MSRVLIIDDDASLLDVLSMALEDAGHDVVRALDGAEGLALARASSVEVIVSDVNMPRVDGFTLVRRLRAEGVATPIMLLTSRDTEIDEALGLDLGADDYVEKPFRARALVARVGALARRRTAGIGDRKMIDQLTIDRARHEVRWRGAPIGVTVTEIEILDELAREPGVVRTRDQLLDRVHGDGTHVAPRLIDTYIRRLRRKLEAVDPSFDRLETVVGAGYRWSDRT